MVERGQHLRLAREARQALGVAREELRQDLQRDVAIEFGVAGAIDLAHTAFAKLVEDLVRTKLVARSDAHESRRLYRSACALLLMERAHRIQPRRAQARDDACREADEREQRERNACGGIGERHVEHLRRHRAPQPE